MGNTKNAALRYRVLDTCFANFGRKYYVEDLIEACSTALQTFNGSESSVSRRTIFEDIKFMQSEEGWSIPLVKKRDGKRFYYRYLSSDFSIYNEPLNSGELLQLQSTLSFLTRFTGLPQFHWLEEALIRLQIKTENSHIIQFDENPYLKGLHFLKPLFNAILNQTVLEIHYQDFIHPDPFVWTFHPYFLKQYNNRWFIVGYNAQENSPTWMLAIDRIQSLDTLNDAYIVNTSIDWNDYFYDIIGVTKLSDENLTNIELWFHPSTAPYILSKPIHGSQKEISNGEDGLIIKVELIPNYEFYQQILSHGNKVKILSPEAIIAHILSIVHDMATLYKK